MSQESIVSENKGALVRARLNHPVIDADGHWIESPPVFFDYLREIAGPQIVDDLKGRFSARYASWYRGTPQERQQKRYARPPFWTYPTNIADRAAAMIPKLLRDRLDDCGLDAAVIFPSMGVALLPDYAESEYLVPTLKAYNAMVADLFRPYANRIIPVGIVTLRTPGETIELLEHAHALGLKQVMMNGSLPRMIKGDIEPQRSRWYVDSLAIDSSHDYDPVWSKFLELKMAVTTHSGSIGWPDRNSPTNFVSNHLGHFAQAHHLFARSLFLGGVTQRFPKLNFGFLEGGVGWACNLYADLMGHWEKRNRAFMTKHLQPSLIDRKRLRELLVEHTSGTRYDGRIDETLELGIQPFEYNLTPERASEREINSGSFDDFSRVNVQSKQDLRRLYADNFYFGCEADDPMTAIAFNDKMKLRLKPVLGSDISHFDVIDATEVLEEAYELVEDGLINEDNFRDLTFANAVKLFAGMNPDFFKGTIVEQAVARELQGAA